MAPQPAKVAMPSAEEVVTCQAVSEHFERGRNSRASNGGRLGIDDFDFEIGGQSRGGEKQNQKNRDR